MSKLDKPLTVVINITDIVTEVLSLNDREQFAVVETQLLTDEGVLVSKSRGIVRNGMSDRFVIRELDPGEPMTATLRVEQNGISTPTGYKDLLSTMGSQADVKAARDAAIAVAVKASGAVVETSDDRKVAVVADLKG